MRFPLHSYTMSTRKKSQRVLEAERYYKRVFKPAPPTPTFHPNVVGYFFFGNDVDCDSPNDELLPAVNVEHCDCGRWIPTAGLNPTISPWTCICGRPPRTIKFDKDEFPPLPEGRDDPVQTSTQSMTETRRHKEIKTRVIRRLIR